MQNVFAALFLFVDARLPKTDVFVYFIRRGATVSCES